MKDPIRCQECGEACWISSADDGYMAAICPNVQCVRIVVEVVALPTDLVAVDDAGA